MSASMSARAGFIHVGALDNAGHRFGHHGQRCGEFGLFGREEAL
jgi:hypothetical protein